MPPARSPAWPAATSTGAPVSRAPCSVHRCSAGASPAAGRRNRPGTAAASSARRTGAETGAKKSRTATSAAWNSGADNAFHCVPGTSLAALVTAHFPLQAQVADGAAVSPCAPFLRATIAATKYASLSSGAADELSSRDQSCIADRHRHGDGSIHLDESAAEERTEQGRLSGGCAQQDALHDHHQLLQSRWRARLLLRRRGRLRRGGRSQRLSRRVGWRV